MAFESFRRTGRSDSCVIHECHRSNDASGHSPACSNHPNHPINQEGA